MPRSPQREAARRVIAEAGALRQSYERSSPEKCHEDLPERPRDKEEKGRRGREEGQSHRDRARRCRNIRFCRQTKLHHI